MIKERYYSSIVRWILRQFLIRAVSRKYSKVWFVIKFWSIGWKENYQNEIKQHHLHLFVQVPLFPLNRLLIKREVTDFVARQPFALRSCLLWHCGVLDHTEYSFNFSPPPPSLVQYCHENFSSICGLHLWIFPQIAMIIFSSPQSPSSEMIFRPCLSTGGHFPCCLMEDI